MRKLLTFLRWVMIIFSVICVLSMVICLCSVYFPPGKAWLVAFFGLFFIPLLILNSGLGIFWVVVRIRHAIIPLIGLLASVPLIINTFGFHFFSKNEKDEPGRSVKLLSFNCRNFDLYNWQHNSDTTKNIFRMLMDEQPDVVCFQEFYTSDEYKGWNTIKDLTEKLKMPYHYFFVSNTVEAHQWGIATFSRYKIINSGTVDRNGRDSRACVFTDLQIDSNVVRVYNLHLQSNHLSYSDYNAIDLADDTSLNINSGTSILKKMKHAYVTRGKQVQMIAKHAQSSPYPVIICGDLNDVPSSFAYHELRGNRQDAFLKKSWGIGFTYDYWLPLFRIDYIFADPKFHINSFKTGNEDLSDHYPVSASFTLNQK